MVQVDLGKKQDSISKITRAKRAEDMAQVVDHLPMKHETLNSNRNKNSNKKF
jgi:hypothetical protein